MDISHKKGDTFIADCIYRDPAGLPVNINESVVHIESAVRSGGKIFPLTVTPLPQQGGFRLQGETPQWSLGQALWDIKYVQNGVSQSSELIRINVYQGATP